MISVVNYGMGNIGSIVNMFKYLNISVDVIDSADKISTADKILLPGVGSFDAAMHRIQKNNLDEALNEAVTRGTPLLGICLGMQLLTKSSAEGKLSGFGWIDAETLSFNKLAISSIKVPHMGWNVVDLQCSSPIAMGLQSWDEIRFYFVHSYYVKCRNPDNVLMTTNYGVAFDSMINKDNVWGAQFHPEKSHKYGMKLLENFARL